MIERAPAQERTNPSKMVDYVNDWNGATRLSPYLPLHVQVALRATRDPDATAVTDATGSLTYRRLDLAARQLARRLREAGLRPEEPVALYLPRGTTMAVAMLGVLSAGGAYLPLDQAQPPERLRFMLADSGARIVLVAADTPGGCEAAVPGTHLIIAVSTEAPNDAQSLAPQPVTPPEQVAYIIYTSGSTGVPKGVAVTHGGLANLVAWHVERYRLEPSIHTSQVASTGFDASVWETWPTLAAGGILHIAPDEVRVHPEQLLAWLAREQIAIAFLPTPIAAELLTVPPRADLALRTLLTGGDRLTVRPRPGTPFQLVNHYGPTESTVVATAGVTEPDADAIPSIGHPIDNLRIHILDRDMRPVPSGAEGELYIGGAGLARGYIGQPAHTAERFVPDPFGAYGGRLYRTGDRGRYLADGSIDFIGRTDTQVKIRGLRIELGEIEACLRERPDVDDAVVIVGTATDLVGYVTGYPDIEAALEYLRGRLPDYMVPGVLVHMERFPLSVNGKVDRIALAAAEPAPPAAGAPHRDALESLVAEAWAEVLGIADPAALGRRESFFHRGGHSLSAHRVIARVNAALGTCLPVQALFEAPTIAEFAEALRASEKPGQLDRIAALIRQVGELSDAEVDRMLAGYEMRES